MSQPWDRRGFGKVVTGAGLGALGLAGGGVARGGDDAAPAETAPPAGNGPTVSFREPSREVPLRDDVDVLVCGGGPAGFSAALTAARAGAKTRLIEVNGCLGGVWTAGLLTYIFDFDKPGLTRELWTELERRDARGSDKPDQFTYHCEEMKCLLEEMVEDAGLQTRLHTRVVAAHKNEANRLTTIVTESKSGREAWRAKTFIDATGDGDLGALAGCDWEFGRARNCPCQPMTMNAIVTVPDVEAIKDYVLFYGPEGKWNFGQRKLKAALATAGVSPSYGAPTLFHWRGNALTFMANHEYGVEPFDADQVTAATMRSRREVRTLVNALRSLGGPWANLELVATAEQIGIRDGRRIEGRYQVVKKDLMVGRRHEDGIARVTFNVDVHADSREKNDSEKALQTQDVVPYDIPLRALIAKDVDGLMMAGRCISGDFISHASYRVTGNSVAMGEAAGLTAALAAKSDRLPHEVPWSAVGPALAKLRS